VKDIVMEEEDGVGSRKQSTVNFALTPKESKTDCVDQTLVGAKRRGKDPRTISIFTDANINKKQGI
jgi:hypothetical protein